MTSNNTSSTVSTQQQREENLESLSDLFMNVSEGDTLEHKEEGTEAVVIQTTELAGKKGLDVKLADKEETMFMPRSIADEWDVIQE